jgi:hypothetical protein
MCLQGSIDDLRFFGVGHHGYEQEKSLGDGLVLIICIRRGETLP